MVVVAYAGWEANPIPYLIAIGQLPDQYVLPANALVYLDVVQADWIACYRDPLADPRYSLFADLPGGSLLRRNR